MDVIQPVTVLHGHTSPDTAYVVEDYPYGRALRCRRRTWVETAVKGAKRGQQRVVHQTTNPKRGDIWNKPHPGQYSRMIFLYIDPDTGHQESAHVSEYGADPAGDLFLHITGIYEQMTDSDRRVYDVLVKLSKRYQDPWDRFDALRQALADHYREHGEIPARDASTGRIPGHDAYLSEYDYKVAAAELRLAVEAREGA
jgi:hypothetical protein